MLMYLASYRSQNAGCCDAKHPKSSSWPLSNIAYISCCAALLMHKQPWHKLCTALLLESGGQAMSEVRLQQKHANWHANSTCFFFACACWSSAPHNTSTFVGAVYKDILHQTCCRSVRNVIAGSWDLSHSQNLHPQSPAPQKMKRYEIWNRIFIFQSDCSGLEQSMLASYKRRLTACNKFCLACPVNSWLEYHARLHCWYQHSQNCLA